MDTTRTAKVSNALTHFVWKHCATFDRAGGFCSNGGFCKLAQGKSCRYFREGVFPICDPAYKFATETKDYHAVFGLLQKIDPRVVQREAVVRLCPDCDRAELLPRQRVCPKCSERRRKLTYRKSRKRAV